MMRYMAWPTFVLVFFLLPSGSVRANPLSYARDVRPLLEKFCFDCHGEVKPKGAINLVQYRDDTSIYRDLKLWENISVQVSDREMPPSDRAQPTDAQREQIKSWIHGVLTALDEKKIENNPGYVVLQRLNRTEYNNTIRDLFGILSTPSDKFPIDGGGGGGFDNNADTLFVPPILLEGYLEAAGEVLDHVAESRILVAKSGILTSKRGAAKKILNQYMQRAFRRPVAAGEIDRYLRLYDHGTTDGLSHEDAVRLALKAVLVSPKFLFRQVADRKTDLPFRLNSWELASNLSYFLWSSMPDDELFALAAAGRLTEPGVLRTQVRRMLADPKSAALANNFALQWLGLQNFRSTVQPDAKRFKDFTPALAEAMLREPVLFFGELLSANVSLLELVDSRHTFVNAELARLYGLEAPTGDGFQRIELPDRTRGGVLTMAAVLAQTSYPLRTSPVLRGKWVLEEIFGTPPPPPPSEVNGLPGDEKPVGGLTLRQKLEQHRSKPACASCHSRLDPPGFGLESFDPIGRWRTEIAGVAVDATGILPGGRAFNGPAELKTLLLERKEQIMKNLTERMLSYALGRGLESYDAPAVRSIMQALKAGEFRAQTLVIEIALSYPFQYRKIPAGQRSHAQTSPLP